MTGVTTGMLPVVGSQASPVAAAVQAGSPPPPRLAVLLPPVAPTAPAATFTGMRTMMVPTVAPVLIWHGAVVLPLTGQADRTAVEVPPVIVGAADRVMPVGSTSVSVSGAVVALLATVIVRL